jgi:four helix bundle protein
VDVQTDSGIWDAESTVGRRAFAFAVDIVHLYKELKAQREFVLSKQVLRSGTSIGANIAEATAAESRRDFVHKMSLASKEAREVHYWLRLLDASNLAPAVDVSCELRSADELVRMLTAIVKTTSNTSKHRNARTISTGRGPTKS